MDSYSIVKQTTTHADTLAAIGAADMFHPYPTTHRGT
jgi:hypothetical protein